MARSKKPLTNVQIVTKLMEFSSQGALAQMFIIDAIGKQCDRIADADIEELRKAFGPNSMISPEAWQATAQDIRTRMKEMYAR